MLRIGHRGAKAYEPENTLLSFQKALEMDVDAIELDVRKTKDNQLVVIHDADIKRTTNGKGKVNQLTLKEIKEFSTEKNQKIPTLNEALDFLDKKTKIIIELKEPDLEQQVLNAIHTRNLQNNTIIISFNEETLKNIKALDKNIQTGLIYVKHKNPIKTALTLQATHLLTLYRFTHTANIQKAHENGLKIIVWTINTKEEATKYQNKGVDGIATDKPDILKPQKTP
jgi:glycerophosphoryl diester phosphodiesterase